MSDIEQKIEITLQSLGVTAPRLTPAMIEELLEKVTYSTHVLTGTTVTVATAVDASGFALCSVVSACAAPETFNPALGIEIAIAKAKAAARDKLWELEGYRLKRALYAARQDVATKALEQLRAVLGATLPPPPAAVPRIVINMTGKAPSEIIAELEQEVASMTAGQAAAVQQHRRRMLDIFSPFEEVETLGLALAFVDHFEALEQADRAEWVKAASTEAMAAAGRSAP